MERKRIFKNGHIVVKNPLAYELPKREVVIKSGRTLYRFTGSYDGQRALIWEYAILYWQTARR